MAKKNINIFISLVTLVLIISGITLLSNKASAKTLASTCRNTYSPNSVDNQNFAACVKHYLNTSVAKKGFLQTEKDLDNSIKVMPQINYVCHPYAHYIGAGAIKTTKDIKIAIKYATPNCEWGYFHGMNVASTSLFHGKALFDQLSAGCNYVKSLNYNEYECAHGMGDAFDTAAGYDLYKAFAQCDLISDIGLHLNCSQGAANNWADYYVVNVAKANLDKIPDSIKLYLSGKPYAKCDSVTNPIDRSGCIDYMVRINNAYKTGLANWNKYCNSYTSSADNESCFQGLGREWAYSKNLSMHGAVSNCLTANTERGQSRCIIELINSRTQMNADRNGIQLKSACKDPSFASNAAVIDGCNRAYKSLAPYFNGSFQM